MTHKLTMRKKCQFVTKDMSVTKECQLVTNVSVNAMVAYGASPMAERTPQLILHHRTPELLFAQQNFVSPRALTSTVCILIRAEMVGPL